jgi:hypothetical protein
MNLNVSEFNNYILQYLILDLKNKKTKFLLKITKRVKEY